MKFLRNKRKKNLSIVEILIAFLLLLSCSGTIVRSISHYCQHYFVIQEVQTLQRYLNDIQSFYYAYEADVEVFFEVNNETLVVKTIFKTPYKWSSCKKIQEQILKLMQPLVLKHLTLNNSEKFKKIEFSLLKEAPFIAEDKVSIKSKVAPFKIYNSSSLGQVRSVVFL